MTIFPEDDYDDFDDFYECEDDPCIHEEYEADILTGVATCDACGHRWIQTKEEIDREYEAQRAYDLMCRAWEAEDAAKPSVGEEQSR